MAYVIVANHLGYLDILVLLCKYRASCVSKGILEMFPVIGTIAAALQCLFVRSGSSLTARLVDEAVQECQLSSKTIRSSMIGASIKIAPSNSTDTESQVLMEHGSKQYELWENVKFFFSIFFLHVKDACTGAQPYRTMIRLCDYIQLHIFIANGDRSVKSRSMSYSVITHRYLIVIF